ncbi:Serine incorporator 3 [Glycine soja]|uniref:Serine incorporator 3 n=1 Tax=Glycine soja TaxID=3848 RepID=A0A445GRV8_GLYSO|nr:Serine incorporator 3 [Glycine soja]
MWSLRCLSRRFVDPQRSWSTPFGEIPLDRWYIRYLHNGMVSSTSSSELGKFHHGGWTAKIVIWLLLVVLAFFLPDAVILVYVIILLDFTHTWNDAWVEKDEQKWYIALLAVSVGCYIAAFTGSGILFFWFNPSGYDCSLNIFFFVMTMILAFVFAIIALHPQPFGGFLDNVEDACGFLLVY